MKQQYVAAIRPDGMKLMYKVRSNTPAPTRCLVFEDKDGGYGVWRWTAKETEVRRFENVAKRRGLTPHVLPAAPDVPPTHKDGTHAGTYH
jgi:hypothetical protein